MVNEDGVRLIAAVGLFRVTECQSGVRLWEVVMTERTQILIEAVPSRFWEFSSFKPPAPQLMNLPRVVSLAISRLPWLLPSREICGSTGCIVCRTHGRCFGKRTIPPQRYRSQCEGAARHHLLNYVLHTALYLPFIDYDKNFAAFFPVIDILFGTYYRPRRDEYPRTGIPAVDFRDTWLRQRSLRLLGFTG